MDALKSLVGWSTTPNTLTEGKRQLLLFSDVAADPNTVDFSRVLSKNEPAQLDGHEAVDVDGAAEDEKNGSGRRIVEILERSWDQSLFAWCSGNCTLPLPAIHLFDRFTDG